MPNAMSNPMPNKAPLCSALAGALSLAVGLSLVAGSTAAAPGALADVPASAIDAVFADWNHTDTPGCAVSVLDHGKVLFQRGYGMASLELDVPISPETVFYIASTSKQFTAVSIALLARDGKLSLDDDVRRYVPELPDYGKTITVSHLVHHTSGLRDYLGLSGLAGHDVADSLPLQQALDLITAQKALNFVPGAEYLYSNSNYLLMTVIAERVSGMSLREFAQQRIFGPLGMSQTQFYDDTTRIVPKRTIGHTRNDDGSWSLLRTSYALVGDGGLLTSVKDMEAWERNFLDNRIGGGAELLTQITTPGKLDDGKPITYGFGLIADTYRGLPTVAHGGSFLAYKADMLRFPQQQFAVHVLCNAGVATPDRYSRRIADLYLAKQFTAPVPTPPARRTPAQAKQALATPAQRAAVAGDYRSDELNVVYHVRLKDGQLMTSAGYLPAVPLRLLDADRAEIEDASVRFTRDGSGKIEGFVLDAGRERGMRFERLPD